MKYYLKRVSEGVNSTKGKVYKAEDYPYNSKYFVYTRDSGEIAVVDKNFIGSVWEIVKTKNKIGGTLNASAATTTRPKGDTVKA